MILAKVKIKMNTWFAIFVIFMSLMVILFLINKIVVGVKIANGRRPFNPPMQMYYKDGKVHFKPGSQRTAWWITFWDVL